MASPQRSGAFSSTSPQPVRTTQGQYSTIPTRVSGTVSNGIGPTIPTGNTAGYTSGQTGSVYQTGQQFRTVGTPTASPMMTGGSSRILSSVPQPGFSSGVVQTGGMARPQGGLVQGGYVQTGFPQQNGANMAYNQQGVGVGIGNPGFNQPGVGIAQMGASRPSIGIGNTPQGGVVITQQGAPQPGYGIGQPGVGQPGFAPQQFYGSPGSLTLKIPAAKLIKDHDLIGKMDPYCIVTVGDQQFKTQIAKSAGLDPKWEDVFNIPLNGQPEVKIQVFDDELFGKELIGQTSIPTQALIGQPQGNIYNLVEKDGKTPAGQIQVLAQFQGVNQNPQANHLFTGAAGGLSQATLTTGSAIPPGQIHPGQFSTQGNYTQGITVAQGSIPAQFQNYPPSPYVGNLYLKVQGGKFIKNHDLMGKMDTYTVVTVGDQQFKTDLSKSGGKEPQWHNVFAIPVRQAPGAHFQVFDKEMIGKDSVIGETFLPLQALAGQGSQTNWFPVTGKDGKPSGQILIASEFVQGNPGQIIMPQLPAGAGMVGNATGPNVFNTGAVGGAAGSSLFVAPMGPPVSGTFTIRPQVGQFLKNADLVGSMDPYVVITVGQQQFKTQVAKSQGKEPRWDDTFSIQANNESNLMLQVYDKDMVGKDDFIGSTILPLSQLAQKHATIGWYPVVDAKGQPSGQVYMATEYLPPGADASAYMYGQQPQGPRPMRNVLDMGFGAYSKINPGYVPQPVLPDAQTISNGQGMATSYYAGGQGLGGQLGVGQQTGGYGGQSSFSGQQGIGQQTLGAQYGAGARQQNLGAQSGAYGTQQAFVGQGVAIGGPQQPFTGQGVAIGGQSASYGGQQLLSNGSYRNLPGVQQQTMQRSYSTGPGTTVQGQQTQQYASSRGLNGLNFK